jgi:hypothetical protein
MTPKLKYRWLAVSLIWVLVMVLSGWNIHLVDKIQTGRQNMETMQMDLRFLKANQSVIHQARLQKSRLTHLVKSNDLGFLVVENNLKRLSWNFGLQKLSVETEKNESLSSVMPITTAVSGPVPAVAGWITAVEDAYPYLVITRMELVYEPATRTGRLQAIFDYHFTISASEPVG